ncbi:NACHT and Ankyrin domain protein [Aspergillus luchuensis]|uniref:NACHT and Ankyrin domain protein n=1 Tax=Aspergillus kawachii TaxID=1069201 RepID=A0A146F398_ASPKA|nr:NACHT and Ankyrin domain protein [Aspergillus luchuensis]
MVDVHAVNCRLAQAAHSVRAAMRSLGGGRESQDSSHKAILAMSEIIDLLYQIREQLSSDEKWTIAQARLNALEELLNSFEITIATMEINFQPGGVGSRVYRKGLLEQTFIQREKAAMEHQLRTSIRTFRDLEPGKYLRSLSHFFTIQITELVILRMAATIPLLRGGLPLHYESSHVEKPDEIYWDVQ